MAEIEGYGAHLLSVFLSRETGISGNFVGRIKGAKCPFDIQFLASTRDAGSILGSGRSAGEGNGNPLQYSCLGNPMDGEAWWATVHGISKSWT